MKDLVSAAGYVFSGFHLILRPGVRRYVIIPLLINVLLFAGVIAVGADLLDNFIHSLAAHFSLGPWISWLLWPLFVVIALVVVFFLFTIVANLVGAPFNGFLAEAVERSLTGSVPGTATSLADLPREILDAIRSEFRKSLYFLVRALPLLLLFVIPFVQVIAPLVWFMFGAWMLAIEYMDFPMGNAGMLFPDIRAMLARRRALAVGFGGAVMILTLIPVVNFIAMPVAVAAATRLWVEKIRDPAAPPRTGSRVA